MPDRHTIRVPGVCWLLDAAYEKSLDLRREVPRVRGKTETIFLGSLRRSQNCRAVVTARISVRPGP